ncbi:GLPGLI family protein [Pedobacter gandavensis]|uniref:GLPGLI family protein n=1 Tax=Pedobacter gandavensis TaxID=2679963 RepID=A0ABR6EU93_9SPHI|nr:GLPGLI family protein [Pedobacter gandavensis]MBB2148766.1 GLPGLI family protein [Pedobacter gandavensis]
MIMKQLACLLIFSISFTAVKAQQLFIRNGTIIFEKKVNVQRQWAESGLSEEARERMKKYKINHWEFSFDSSKSIFRPSKKEEESNENSFFGSIEESENELYANYDQQKRIIKKKIWGEDYLLNDSIPKVEWKIMHDIRNIAGYDCRKAVGIINDSVYVVAFYTDEILLKGGPEGFSGLPGMILGLAIPRYFSTWFATKVTPYTEQSLAINPPSKGKKTDTPKEFNKLIEILTRYEQPQKQKPEEVKKRLYGFTL